MCLFVLRLFYGGNVIMPLYDPKLGNRKRWKLGVSLRKLVDIPILFSYRCWRYIGENKALLLN